nr:MAG TPA: hypothetical protein [Caudoviricetes sp.]
MRLASRTSTPVYFYENLDLVELMLWVEAICEVAEEENKV